jgi:DNA mismatch repair protein
VPTVKDGVPYDVKDEKDILRFAKELKGQTLGEWVLEHEHRVPVRRKGMFGQILEEAVFGISTNSESAPDLEEAGIEIKTTPIIKRKKGPKAPKERLVLSIINYMTILDKGWELSFLRKNGKLLIIFYQYEEGKSIYEYKILDVILWEYPPDDLRIIEEDWKTIARMVKEGKAHELSERHTMYLGACRKGAGHGLDLRAQPFSDVKAEQRAFSLKQSYLGQIWKKASDTESLMNDPTMFNEEKTFEEKVADRFAHFKGRRTDDIECELGIKHSTSKSRYAALARRMLGVKTNRVAEFDKADVSMKTIRINAKGIPKEDMAFRRFKYEDLSSQEWEDSDFYGDLNRRFLFVIYRVDHGDLWFEDVKFWSMPYDDLKEAKRVWTEAKKAVEEHRFDDLPKIVDSRVSHVRAKGKNGKDKVEVEDGSMQMKKCFWFNKHYVAEQIKKN